MTWTLFSAFLLLSFGLGFFFGVLLSASQKIKIEDIKNDAKRIVKGKYKCYSPQTDPDKLFLNEEFSYFDEAEEPIELSNN